MFFGNLPAFLPASKMHRNVAKKGKKESVWERRGNCELQKMKSAVILFRNDCLITSPAASSVKVLITDWELLLTKLGILGCRASVGWSQWDQGPHPGQRSHHSKDSRKAHFNINFCWIHETLLTAALTRHPEIWHSSFREVKRRSLEVNDRLYQEHQQTRAESHSSQPGRRRRLIWGKMGTGQAWPGPSGGSRWDESFPRISLN